ncbi:myb-related transcription factor, partner of profilin [Syngnathus acus]|uniref:myb-related transcription factor, partner of profilin n=1 Tax=Syngnathus acus TaxID=161584 RepID=UPI001886052A|nr:myb-related transcription factor, partner of profilin [Syngnathus acus]
MTEYCEDGGLLYEQSPPMHIKVESPEGLSAGGASDNGFPRDDDDSEGSCDQSSGPRGGLPFNVVVVHPKLMAPGMSSDDLLSIEQNRAMSAALAANGAGKRKSRFSGAELEVLVSEVTRCEGELFGPAGRLRRRERERIWAGILERVNAVSRVPRTLREVKKRWDDLKRRNGGRLADARHRSWSLPSSRAVMLGQSSQSSPRLQHGKQKQSSRPKPTFTCFPESDTGFGGEGSEKDALDKDDDNPEHERDVGVPDCDDEDNSMEDKLGLGLGLGIGAPPTSERWLPPSPLYSAPFLNGSPEPNSPQPSLGAQQGPLEAPPRGSWLEDELRGLGEAAIQLGNGVDKSLREFADCFRQDMRTLVASQEALALSLQQNNVLLQRLLGVLEAQQQQQCVQQTQYTQASQPQQQQHAEQHLQQHIDVPQHIVQQQHKLHQLQLTLHSDSPSAGSVVPSPSSPDLQAAFPSHPPAGVNGCAQKPRRGRAFDHRRRRRR